MTFSEKVFYVLSFSMILQSWTFSLTKFCIFSQVLALVIDPTNFNEIKYPEDAKRHAQAILDSCDGKSVGSYTDSNGIEG